MGAPLERVVEVGLDLFGRDRDVVEHEDGSGGADEAEERDGEREREENGHGKGSGADGCPRAALGATVPDSGTGTPGA